MIQNNNSPLDGFPEHFDTQGPGHFPSPRKKNTNKTVAVALVSVVVSSLATLSFLSVFGLQSDWLTVLPRNEAARYTEYRSVYTSLSYLKDLIEEKYYIPPDQQALQTGIYKGLFEGLNDPYSQYLTAKELSDTMISASGQYDGIGVSIVPDEQGYINVVAPIEDSPAEKAGIKAGDKIIQIDDTEYTGKTIDQAVAVMRGKAGTSVKITVLRGQKVISYTLERASVTRKTVKSEMLPDRIGYIRIAAFESATAKDFEAALSDMEKKKASGLIIDLRGNPGGLVDQSVEITDELVDSGLIVYTENQSGEREDYKASSGKTSLPYAILIDKGSASASEILAGAVKDHEAGLLVGTTTYGKGIIQQLFPLSNGDGIKLTVSQYFSPDGHVIHQKGVEPDIEVALEESDFIDGALPRANDRQLNTAIEELKKRR